MAEDCLKDHPEILALVRSNLLAYTTYTHQRYSAGWFHRLLAARLMQFFLDVQDGLSPRLILLVPPRHGKSELVSVRAPAWFLGQNPELNFISVSHTESLARKFCRSVQRQMDSRIYRQLFPEAVIKSAEVDEAGTGALVRTASFFETNRGGQFQAIGVGGGIAGEGGDIINIDDPIGKREQAESASFREKLWAWYGADVHTRLAPGGGVLVTHTRWHDEDLAGKLITAMEDGSGEKFEVLRFPAIAEENEAHRKQGEALHPDRWPLSALESKKKVLGTADFEALYQQNVTAAGGNIFQRDWFRVYRENDLPARFDRILQSWDFSFKDTEASARVSGTVWGLRGANVFLLDDICRRMTFIESMQAVRATSAKWPGSLTKLIEDKANGPAIINVLKSDIPGIVPINPSGSKVERAKAVTPYFEAGNVWVPHKSIAPWGDDFIEELCRFPHGKFADRVDSTSQALNYLRRRKSLSALWD